MTVAELKSIKNTLITNVNHNLILLDITSISQIIKQLHWLEMGLLKYTGRSF